MSSKSEKSLAANDRLTQTSAGDVRTASPLRGPVALGDRRIRMLRLAQVIDVTGLGKTKIYELQAEGRFPMRVKLTAHSVAWIEDEVQAWLAQRIESNTPLTST